LLEQRWCRKKHLSKAGERVKTAMIRYYKVLIAIAVVCLALPSLAQTCYSGSDLNPADKTKIQQAATQFLNMSAQGDVFNLKQNSIPALAGNFGGIERAVIDNREYFSAAPATIRGTYLLDATGTTGIIESARFYCGVFGSTGQTNMSAGFQIPNLPSGKYAVVIQDVDGPKGLHTLTLVMQELAGQWKLAGYYAKTGLLNGHDSDWFANQARQFKAKGQDLNAFFYFMQARDLAAPVPFISTLKLDKLADEAQQVAPKDIPQGAGGPVNFQAGAKTYKILNMYPVVVGTGLNLVVKYESPDISNTAQTFQDNTALMKAMLAKHPEMRDGFEGMVARAVAPSGQDYGTLLAMRDIK
jgi:hypothetical protein